MKIKKADWKYRYNAGRYASHIDPKTGSRVQRVSSTWSVRLLRRLASLVLFLTLPVAYPIAAMVWGKIFIRPVGEVAKRAFYTIVTGREATDEEIV